MAWLRLGLQSLGKLWQAGKAPIQASLRGGGGTGLVRAGRHTRLARVQDTLRASRANFGQTWNALGPEAQRAVRNTAIAGGAGVAAYGFLSDRGAGGGYGGGYPQGGGYYT